MQAACTFIVHLLLLRLTLFHDFVLLLPSTYPGIFVVKHSWEAMTSAVNDHIASLNWGYRVELREKNVTYLNAFGEFIGDHKLKVGEGQCTCTIIDNVCLAYYNLTVTTCTAIKPHKTYLNVPMISDHKPTGQNHGNNIEVFYHCHWLSAQVSRYSGCEEYCITR